MKFFAILSLITFVVANGEQPGWILLADNAPADGFEEVTSTINVDPKTPDEKGYYAANQHHFKDGSIQYFGLQPWSNGNQGVYYLVFGEHTEMVDTNRCKQGADNGPGISCLMVYQWKKGVEYTFELKVTKKFDDGRRLWNGTLIEPSGKRIYIASWITGKEKGALTGANSQWLEWWRYNDDGKKPEERYCQPYGKATFGTPMFGKIPAKITGQIRNVIMDKCAFAAGTPNTRGGKLDGYVWVESGFLKNNDGSTTLKTSASTKASSKAQPTSSQAKPTSSQAKPTTESKPQTVYEGDLGGFGDWLKGLFNF